MHEFTEEKIPDDHPVVKAVNYQISILCGEDPDDTEYNKDWFAMLVQKPAEKQTMILYYSRAQGTGKSNLMGFMNEYVLSENNVLELTDMKQLTGHFNGASANNLLVVCEEGKEDGKCKDPDVMKNLISSHRLAHRALHKEVEKGKNYAKYVGLTNHKPSGTEIEATDRRHKINQSSEEHVDDFEYHTNFRKLVNNNEAGRIYFNWLAQRDISNFNVWQMPANKIKDEIRRDALRSPLQHVIDICEGQRDDVVIARGGSCNIGVKELYADYQAWSTEQGIKYDYKQLKYKDMLINELGISYCKHGGKWVMELDYDSIDKAFQKILKTKKSIFSEEKPAAKPVDDESDEEEKFVQ